MNLTAYWSSESITALLPSPRTPVACLRIGYTRHISFSHILLLIRITHCKPWRQYSIDIYGIKLSKHFLCPWENSKTNRRSAHWLAGQWDPLSQESSGSSSLCLWKLHPATLEQRTVALALPLARLYLGWNYRPCSSYLLLFVLPRHRCRQEATFWRCAADHLGKSPSFRPNNNRVRLPKSQYMNYYTHIIHLSIQIRDTGFTQVTIDRLRQIRSRAINLALTQLPPPSKNEWSRHSQMFQ